MAIIRESSPIDVDAWPSADQALFAAQFQSWVDGRFERLTERGVFKGVKSINSLHGLKFGSMSFSVDVSFLAWPRRDVVVPVGDVKPEKVFTSQSQGWSSRLGSQRGGLLVE